MPQVLLKESMAVEFGAGEPWPYDVEFYQPYEVEQILLPDNAACLSVQAFLKMCNLSYSRKMRENAEYMSPSGRVPFIHAGAFVIAELDPIVAFVGNKGVSLTESLDSSQKADMRAFMSLVNNVLGSAELYISWIDPKTYEEVTKPRYGYVFPWPLNIILTYQKWQQMAKKLKVLGWKHKTLDEVCHEVDRCCNALSVRLDTQHPYFFGNKPTELDALVFGHLYSLITTSLPDNRLGAIARSFSNLVRLCQKVDQEYFGGIAPRLVEADEPGNGRSSTSSGGGNGDDSDMLEDFVHISN